MVPHDEEQDAFKTGVLSPVVVAAIEAELLRVRDALGRFGDTYEVDEAKVQEVDAEGYPGFVPYTNGGRWVEVRGMIAQAASEGNYPRSAHYYVEQYLGAQSDEEEGGDEADWADGFYFYQAKALVFLKGNSRNQTGEDEVYFFATVNTAEYGGDSGKGKFNPDLPEGEGGQGDLDDVFDRTVKVSDLTAASVREIADEIIQGFRKNRNRVPVNA